MKIRRDVDHRWCDLKLRCWQFHEIRRILLNCGGVVDLSDASACAAKVESSGWRVSKAFTCYEAGGQGGSRKYNRPVNQHGAVSGCAGGVPDRTFAAVCVHNHVHSFAKVI